MFRLFSLFIAVVVCTSVLVLCFVPSVAYGSPVNKQVRLEKDQDGWKCTGCKKKPEYCGCRCSRCDLPYRELKLTERSVSYEGKGKGRVPAPEVSYVSTPDTCSCMPPRPPRPSPPARSPGLVYACSCPGSSRGVKRCSHGYVAPDMAKRQRPTVIVTPPGVSSTSFCDNGRSDYSRSGQ